VGWLALLTIGHPSHMELTEIVLQVRPPSKGIACYSVHGLSSPVQVVLMSRDGVKVCELQDGTK
jgi:hypothetical protein